MKETVMRCRISVKDRDKFAEVAAASGITLSEFMIRTMFSYVEKTDTNQASPVAKKEKSNNEGKYTRREREQTVNLPEKSIEGSNPSLPTKYIRPHHPTCKCDQCKGAK